MSVTTRSNERVSTAFAERVIGEAVKPPWPWWGFVLAAALLSAVKVSWKAGDLSLALDVNGVTAPLIALMWLPSVLRVIARTGGSFKTAAGEASSGGFLSLIGGLAEGPQLLGTIGAALEDAERGTAGSQQKETSAALDAVREQLTTTAAKAGSPLQTELSRLANEYETVRKVMQGGGGRTWQMSSLVEQAQPAVRASTDDEAWLRQWIAGFDGLGDGERVMALGALRARPIVPEGLHAASAAILVARSPFEQYQALQAARNLAPTLNQEQRRQLRNTVETALAGQASPVAIKGSDRESVARDLLIQLR